MPGGGLRPEKDCKGAASRSPALTLAATTPHQTHNTPPHTHTHSANPPATAAAFTGLYAVAAGLALLAAPRPTLGLLFADAAAVPSGWIRVGGVLFATFGLQYLGAALGDFWLSKGGIRDEKGRAATAGQPLPPAAEAEAEAEAASPGCRLR